MVGSFKKNEFKYVHLYYKYCHFFFFLKIPHNKAINELKKKNNINIV
jgi:hypothetical protein